MEEKTHCIAERIRISCHIVKTEPRCFGYQINFNSKKSDLNMDQLGQSRKNTKTRVHNFPSKNTKARTQYY